MKRMFLLIPLVLFACKSREYNQDSQTRTAAPSAVSHEGCAQVSAKMINPATGECRLAADACETRDLEKKGWLDNPACRLRTDTCEKFVRAESMVSTETGRCVLAGDGCSVSNLEMVGFKIAACKAEPCTTLFIKAQPMVNPEGGGCKMAGDKCVADNFAAVGFISSKRECVNTNCAMFIMAQTMFNPQSKKCTLAGNGCAVSNLEGAGFRRPNAGECAEQNN